jgi:hypothetical protein
MEPSLFDFWRIFVGIWEDCIPYECFLFVGLDFIVIFSVRSFLIYFKGNTIDTCLLENFHGFLLCDHNRQHCILAIFHVPMFLEPFKSKRTEMTWSFWIYGAILARGKILWKMSFVSCMDLPSFPLFRLLLNSCEAPKHCLCKFLL